MILKRHFITLIEVLLVIALLSLATGVVALNLQKAVGEQHFQNEVQQVVDNLRLAQDLMLIAGAEVKMSFKGQEDGLIMHLECDDKLPEKWNKLLVRTMKLKHIHQVNFEGGDTLLFLSRGSVMSRGVLTLAASNHEMRYIPLEGYPAPIRVEKEFIHLKDENFELQELAELTVAELKKT